MSDKLNYTCGRAREVYESEDESSRGGEAKANVSAIDKHISQNSASVSRYVYDAHSGDWLVLKKGVTSGKLDSFVLI